jgi:hypothetical protein
MELEIPIIFHHHKAMLSGPIQQLGAALGGQRDAGWELVVGGQIEEADGNLPKPGFEGFQNEAARIHRQVQDLSTCPEDGHAHGRAAGPFHGHHPARFDEGTHQQLQPLAAAPSGKHAFGPQEDASTLAQPGGDGPPVARLALDLPRAH